MWPHAFAWGWTWEVWTQVREEGRFLSVSSFPIGSVESLKSAVWRKRLDATSGQRRDNRLSGWFPCILRAVYRWKTNREPKRKGSCTQLPRCDIDFFPFNAHNGLSLSGLKKFQPACCLIPVLVSYFLLFSSFPGNFNSKISNNSERDLIIIEVCSRKRLRISKKKEREEREKNIVFFSFRFFFKYFLFSRFSSFFLSSSRKENAKKYSFGREFATRLTLKCRLLKCTVDF